jgi:hypothetical protein
LWTERRHDLPHPGRELLERPDVRLSEVSLQVQVLRRVTRKAQLRKHHQVGAFPAGALDPLGDLPGVAVYVSHRGVDLGKCELHVGVL